MNSSNDCRRLIRAFLVASVLVGVVTSPVFAEGREEQLQTSLDQFCDMWMGFLRQRETDNKAKVAWRASAEGVEGEFVGYDKKFECRLSNFDPKAVPVGTIKYLEFKYRHRGASTTEALDNRPKIIEATEVTEIFRYSKTKWVY